MSDEEVVRQLEGMKYLIGNSRTMEVFDRAIECVKMMAPHKGFTDDLLDQGYTKGRLDAVAEIRARVRAWNTHSSKKIPSNAIVEITKEMLER